MESIEHRLSVSLRHAEAIGDAGFTDSVMRALPARRGLASRKARRTTLASAAVAGGAATAILGSPLDGAFSWLAQGNGSLTFVVAAVFATGLAATCFWVFWSD
jgi:hypothetical protein